MRLLVMVLVAAALGCGGRVSYYSSARAELERRGFDYTAEHFLVAAGAGYLGAVRLFVEAGMSVNTANAGGWTALHNAVMTGTLPVVKFLVSQGADINAKGNNTGMTPLHPAAAGGHLSVVKFLVSQGADVTARTNYGNTARDFASLGHTEVAEYLESVGG